MTLMNNEMPMARRPAAHIIGSHDAVVVECEFAPLPYGRSVDWRHEGVALLETLGRTDWHQSARLNVRLGTRSGSTEVTAGFVVESFDEVAARHAAGLLVGILRAVTNRRVEFAIRPFESGHVLELGPAAIPSGGLRCARVVASDRVASVCGGNEESPLGVYLGGEDVGVVVSAALHSGLAGEDTAELIVVGRAGDSRVDVAASLVAYEISGDLPDDEGLGLECHEGETAVAVLLDMPAGVRPAAALPVGVVADLWSVGGRSWSKREYVGVVAYSAEEPDEAEGPSGWGDEDVEGKLS